MKLEKLYELLNTEFKKTEIDDDSFSSDYTYGENLTYNIEKQEKDLFIADFFITKDLDGDELEFQYSFIAHYRKEDDAWGIDFVMHEPWGDTTSELTNMGQPQLVFSAVNQLAKEFIKLYNPKSIIIVSVAREPKRHKFYKKMALKLSSQSGFKITDEGTRTQDGEKVNYFKLNKE